MATQGTIADATDALESLLAKIRILSEVAWDRDCDGPIVDQWLAQFIGSSGFPKHDERYHMLYLLTNFLYFGTKEVREMLRSLYRDIFKYRVVERIRQMNDHTTDASIIHSHFDAELRRTRFLPIGNPSESSSHLLYYFRQENRLPKQTFINTHEVFSSPDKLSLRDPSICRYVFIDDFAGSGDQAVEYADEIATPIHNLSPDSQVLYYVLIATTDALDRLRRIGTFLDVDCIFELTEDFRTFSADSLSFVNAPADVSKDKAETIATHYGTTLLPSDPLGYSDGQLLLGFSHNVPDNSLPIFWFPEAYQLTWTAPFPRYPKFDASFSEEDRDPVVRA